MRNSSADRVCSCMSFLVIFLISLFSSVALTGAFRSVALRTHLLDIPVSRSAHKTPVPVGGGVVLVCILLFAVISLYLSKRMGFPEFMAFGGALLIAIVGFVDDIKELPINWRIIPQLACSTWAVWWLGGIPEIDFLGFTLSTTWLLNGLGIIALLWLVNLYNFMDGIDGIAVSELVFVNVMSLLFVIKFPNSEVFLLSLVSLGAACGFLMWNWAPAKIFMGDVGSGFIGFVIGLLAIITLHHGLMTVWTWLILLAVFVVDTLVTLFRRFLAGKKWYQGHASHAYQKAAKHFNSHQKVTITVMLINVLWLSPLAWCSMEYPNLGIVMTVIAIVPLLVLAFFLEAGKDEAIGLANELA
ncbi:MAG: glycosyltransferase family 4 protein [Pseudohongiellaceae bacterium]